MSRTDERIRKIQDAMKNDLRRPWTTEELARLVNLSPSHLRELFKEEIGQTPLQHLKSLRLRAAHAFLTTEFLTVKEVMHRVGINSCSHFVKDFKKLFGEIPSRVE